MSVTDRVGKNTCFDLSFLYKGIEDPLLRSDMEQFVRDARIFSEAYRSKVAQYLSDALPAYEELEMRANKLQVYVGLRRMLDVTDPKVQALAALVDRHVANTVGKFLSFFPIEVGKISLETVSVAYKKNSALLTYQPWIDRQRLYAPHRLSENIEEALIKREPFGPGSWGTFFEEVSAQMRFRHASRVYGLEEILKMMSESRSALLRSRLLQVLNQGLAGSFEQYMAQALYMVVGSHGLEVVDRGYKHPMEPSQKENMLTDATVTSLHDAVVAYMAPLARRFYRLKAKMLGIRRLAWSDRNAPVVFHADTYIPFEKARHIVQDAYHAFSPILGGLVKDMFDKKRVDVTVSKHKQSGAFNWSVVLPDHGPTSFVFLQHFGTSRSVMTLAHELGHAVHGLLAGEAQGALSGHAPLAYAETASVFGERLVFEALKSEYQAAGDDKGYLSLLFSKIDDVMNTVLRQISFSNFERRLHGMDAAYTVWGEPIKRSAEELSSLWMDVTRECYGPAGDVFSYAHADKLWSYISHFHRPFYVYSYACGELLTHSLYAKRQKLLHTFSAQYVEVLRAGGTKDMRTLLQPFGVNPTDVDFWKQGIMSGIESMIVEAEERARAFLKKH